MVSATTAVGVPDPAISMALHRTENALVAIRCALSAVLVRTQRSDASSPGDDGVEEPPGASYLDRLDALEKLAQEVQEITTLLSSLL